MLASSQFAWTRQVQIITLTTLLSERGRAQHGIFVETRLRKLVESAAAVDSACRLTPHKPAVYFGVARHAVRPRALRIDKLDCLGPNARPRRLIGERRHHSLRQTLRLVWREEVTGLAVADQFTVTADARGDDDALLGHGLERLEGRYQLGEPDRNAREDEQISQIIVTPYLHVRDPSGESNTVADAEFSGQLMQRGFLWATPGEEQGNVGPALAQQREGAQQQVQALVEIERAEEGENGLPYKAKPSGESAVGSAGAAKGVAIDRVGDDRDPFTRDAAVGYVLPQPLTDRRHRIGAAPRMSLEQLRRMIPQICGTVGAVVSYRILPQRSHFIHDRQAVPATGADRRQCVEHRRVGMQNIGPHFGHPL